MASSVWLPWLVLAVEVTLRRRSRLPVVGLALLTALAIDGGHPGTEVQTVGAAGLYGLVRAFTLVGRDAGSGSSGWRGWRRAWLPAGRRWPSS